MSAKTMGQIWEKELPFNKAWVLMAMADHADHDGNNVFPRLGFIAWKTGYSKSSVKRIVAELRKENILVPTGHTKGGVVIYRVKLDHLKTKPQYVEEDSGRPQGTVEYVPRTIERGGIKLNPDYFNTPFCDTNNHHIPNNKKSISSTKYLGVQNMKPATGEDLEKAYDEDYERMQGGAAVLVAMEVTQ